MRAKPAPGIVFERNGGGNWNRDYKKMADAFLVHIASGTPLAESLLAEARKTVAEIKRKNVDSRPLCEFAVNWVGLNPIPVKLPPPDYNR